MRLYEILTLNKNINENWDHYTDIGHVKGSSIVYYMFPGGKMLTHLYNGKKDNHDVWSSSGNESKAIAVGRIDNITKKISVRTPLAPGNSFSNIPQAKLDFICKKLKSLYPDFEIWYFGNAATEIRRLDEEVQNPKTTQKYVYHGTTLFEWNSQKDGQCFFTSSKEEAVRYAEEANIAEYERKHTDREGVLKGYYGNEEEPIIDESIVSIIVKFSLADLLNLQNNGAKFEPDWGWDGCTSQTTWQTSLKTVGSFCIENFKHEFKKLGKIIKV
jgi:hypothetical protein